MIMTALRIHLQGIKTALATRMAYRGDFLISMLIMLGFELLVPMFTYLVYHNGASIPGWGMYEILLIQGIFLLSRGIAFPFFFGIVWNTIERVREGTFDLLLIKPRPVLQMAIVTGFDSEDLGKLFGGLVLFFISVSHLPASGIGQWLQFLAIFSVSMLVLFGYALILAGLGIVWVGNFRVYDIFFAITNFAMYPMAIFSKAVQILITMVIPIAVLGFLPASVLLGKISEGTWLVIGNSIVFLVFSLWFWGCMLKKYTSVGG